MRKIFIAFVLMIVGFAAFADVVHTSYKSTDLGEVFIEFDKANKGAVYEEINVLACQAHLSQFYSEDFNVNVSKIYYQSRDIDNYGFNAFVYKTTKEHGWLIATVDNAKFCFYNVDDNTVATFTIELFLKE